MYEKTDENPESSSGPPQTVQRRIRRGGKTLKVSGGRERERRERERQRRREKDRDRDREKERGEKGERGGGRRGGGEAGRIHRAG